MSPIVSKSHKEADTEMVHYGPWRKPLLASFHGVMASIYGFAICWQNVSAASLLLYQRSNPAMRVYGKWRYLTFNCLVMQFVAYSLCFTAHFVPKLRKPRDFFFTTFALPIGTLVVVCFWSVWALAGRENIFPQALEAYYPPWLNHVSHTIILPVNLIELLMVKHQYFKDRYSLTSVVSYTSAYSAFVLYIRSQTGKFVYPFLNKMDAVQVGVFIATMVVSSAIVYKMWKLVSDLRHGVKSINNGCLGRFNKKTG